MIVMKCGLCKYYEPPCSDFSVGICHGTIAGPIWMDMPKHCENFALLGVISDEN